MFGKRDHYSSERILDPATGVRVPVVLNPKMEIADPQLPARDRVNQYVRFIKEQGTRYCLFTPTGLKVSRASGVSLSSQVEQLAVTYQLEDESIIAQFGETYYLANLSSGFVVRETLVPIAQFDANDLGQNEVIALRGVKGSHEMGIRVIDAALLLSGRGVTKSHLFQTEVKAFAAAGYRHPVQIRKAIFLVSACAILFATAYSYRAYELEQQRIEQQKRAAVIPPKVGKDSSVEQLRAYAQWLHDHLHYYLRNGLQNIEISASTLTLRGRVEPASFIKFYEHHKSLGVLPNYAVVLSPAGDAGGDIANSSTWTLQLNLERPIPGVAQFGLELFENYVVTMSAALPRINFAGSSETPSVNAYGIKEGQFNIVGEYTSPKNLYNLANVMIGIPSYTQGMQLNFANQSSAQMTIQMRLVGRG